jgi:hypothetical protein
MKADEAKRLRQRQRQQGHRCQRAVDRMRERWPNARLVQLPAHASWLNQVEIYFSVVQIKVLTPNDFADLAEVGIPVQSTKGSPRT